MSDHEAYSKAKLAQDLSALAHTEVTSKLDLDQWYQQAKLVQKRLSSSSPEELGNMPEFVWHYLSDADTRFKDSEYADVQNRMMERLITYLERDIMPSGDEISEK